MNQEIKMRNTDVRSISQALAIYLFWLRTGLDQQTIGSIFNVDQVEVSRFCQQIRDGLADFVKSHLGANIKTREDWLKHNTYIVKKLFDLKENQMAIVADGTYCYIQKSSNNYFQRKTYSVQKKDR